MFMMMIISIASGALLAAPEILDDISKPPSPLPQLPPEEYPGFYKHLVQCAKKFNIECGQKIYFAIYFGNTTLSYECCDKLVNELGKPCHEDLIRFFLKSQTFKYSASQIVARAQQTWNNCSVIVD